MHKKHFMKKSLLISTLFTGLLFTACQKNTGNPDDNGGSTDQDAVTLQASASADDQAENIYNDAFVNAMGANDDAGLGAGIGVFFKPGNTGTNITSGIPVTSGDGTAGTPPSCVTVSADPVTAGVFPKTLTIDFGTGCNGTDGHIRRGKIIAVYTGRMRNAGSKATITFDGFYFDSLKVEGTIVAENKSNANGFVFTVTVTNGAVTDAAGNYIQVNRTHTWTQTGGNGTAMPADDVYSITGNSNGTASNGSINIQWATEITTPVVRKFTCRWRVSGQVTITHSAKTAVLDYGNGDCDNAATLTINGKVKNITLH